MSDSPSPIPIPTPTPTPSSVITLEENKFNKGEADDSIQASGLAIVEDNLYIAAIAFSDNTEVVMSVGGLGLTWTKLTSQCSNMDSVQLEAWYTIAPSSLGSGNVTVTFSDEVDNTHISVSRYSGVDVSSPFGSLAHANPLGSEAAATCGAPGTNSKDIIHSITSSTENSYLLSILAFDKSSNNHSEVSFSEFFEEKDDDLSLVHQKFETSSINTYVLDSDLSVAARWSSIILEINPQP